MSGYLAAKALPVYSTSGGGAYVLREHVRCGGTLIFVTWPRVGAVACLMFLFALVLSTFLGTAAYVSGSSSTTSSSVAFRSSGGVGGGLVGSAASASAAGAVGVRRPKSPRRVRDPNAEMPRFCEERGSLYFLQNRWQPMSLGGEFPSAGDIGRYCNIKKGASAEVPFDVCTYSVEEDSQVSQYIQKEGVWLPGKRDMLQRFLPRRDRGMAEGGVVPFPERFIVIDVGANIGFYTVLAAKRGYDVISIEPSRDSAVRMLFTLQLNDIAVTTWRGATYSIGDPLVRTPIVTVYLNAASDSSDSVALRLERGNPGASAVIPSGGSEKVTTVYLDDILIDGDRDPTHPPPPLDVVSPINPRHVRVLKISAEGMDTRVLHGARRLLARGQVPYVLLVFSSYHIQQMGCNSTDIALSLFQVGYRLYYSGVFIDREEELGRFVRGIGSFSTEVLFVAEGVQP